MGLAGQKITVKVYHEIPGIVLDSGYKAADKTLLVAEEKQSFDDQKVLDNGTFSADFVVKAEWKDSHPDTDPFQTFVLEVLKKTRDAEGHDQINLLASQYRTNDALPFELLRPVKQIGMRFLQTDLGTDNESLVSYRRQYLVKENALLVTRNPAPNTAPQPSPTIVTFEDLDVEEKKECYCNRDFTVEDVKKMLITINNTDVIWGGSIIIDKSIEKLTLELNKMFRFYDINRCMQKICFLAQVADEVDFFRISEEGRSQYKSSQSTYKGRGILQLTGEDDGTGYYNNPGPYKAYADFVGNQTIVSIPATIASDIHYSIDSGGWEWGDKVNGKKCPQWTSSAPNIVWKNEYFSKALSKTLNKIALLAELKEDEEKYFFLVSKLLNGYPVAHRLEDPIGWPKRKNAFKLLKEDFLNTMNCTTVKALDCLTQLVGHLGYIKL